MKYTLRSGQTILFDKEDLHYLICSAWWIAHGYLRTSGDNGPISFHRLILGFPEENIDHINGNTLDNRKLNLRQCNQTTNMFNKKTKKHTSEYRGVSWSKHRKQWRATIMQNKKQVFIGYFLDEKEAFQAYLNVAKKIYGFLPYEVTK